MSHVLLEAHYNKTTTNSLPSKGNFDTLEITEMKKPEIAVSGYKNNRDSVPDSDLLVADNPSIAERPNFYKEYGSSVSTRRFIKLNPCEATFWLMANHPVAYLLLNLIALRAQRTKSSLTGLKIGEALIGDYNAIGATRQQYRTALGVLTRLKYITICETCRTRKKSTTGTTTVGTKVKLLTSELWDINEEIENHRINQCPTTDQPPTNHEQECKEVKECNNIYSPKGSYEPSEFATSLLSEFYSSLFICLPDFPKEKAKKTRSQYQAADRLLKNYPLEIIKSVISYAHTPGGFWAKHVHSVTYLEKKFVTLHEQLKHPMNKKLADQKPSRHNNPDFAAKEQKPLAFNNKLSFKDHK